jgi:hypothetical protein
MLFATFIGVTSTITAVAIGLSKTELKNKKQ